MDLRHGLGAIMHFPHGAALEELVVRQSENLGDNSELAGMQQLLDLHGRKGQSKAKKVLRNVETLRLVSGLVSVWVCV